MHIIVHRFHGEKSNNNNQLIKKITKTKKNYSIFLHKNVNFNFIYLWEILLQSFQEIESCYYKHEHSSEKGQGESTPNTF